MGKQQSDLDKLYNAVSAQFDIGDIETFRNKMRTSDDRRKFYDAVSENGFDLGDYNAYESRLGKQTGVSSQGSAVTSAPLADPTNVSSPSSERTNTTSQEQGTSSSAQLPPLADPTNVSRQINQANRIASEYGQEGESYQLEVPEGYRLVEGERDSTGAIINPYYVNETTGERSNIIPTVDTVAVTREQALAQNERIAQQEALEDKGFLSDMYNNLQTGLTSFNAGLSSIPEYLYRAAAVPQNLLADAIENNMGDGSAEWLRARYQNVENGVYNPLRILGDYSKGQKEQSAAYQSQVTQFEDDILGSIGSGRFGDAGRQILGSIVQSAPAIVGMAATGGAASAAGLGSAATTAVTALPFAAGAYQDIEDNPNMNENMKLAASALKGLSEVIFEQEFGTLALIKGITNRTMGREAAKEAVEGYMTKLLNSNGIPASALKGSISEGATTLAQNMIEKYSGENPDKDLWEGVADAMIVGGVMDAGISGLGSISARINNPQIKEEVIEAENQIAAMRRDLENLSQRQAQVLQQAIEAKAEQINNAVARDEAASPVLTQGQQAQADGIIRRANELQSILDTEQVSEETQAAVQQEIQTLQQDRQSIIDNAFAQGEVDLFVTNFQENNPNTTVDLFEDLPDQVVRTFNRVENQIPTDPTAIDEASTWLYNKYQELTDLKANPDRLQTIEQIEGIQEQLALDIETLENYRYEQTGERTEREIESHTATDTVTGEQIETQVETTAQEGEQVNEAQQPSLESIEVPMESVEAPPVGESDTPTQEVVETQDVTDTNVGDMPVDSEAPIERSENFKDAAEAVVESGVVDVTGLSESLGITQPEAEALITELESAGIVSPMNEESGRTVLINSPEELSVITSPQTIVNDIPQTSQTGQEAIQEAESTEVRPEAVQESENPSDEQREVLRGSYERLTEGMTPEQIEADPELVRMRERAGINPQATISTSTTEPSSRNARSAALREKYGFGERIIPERETNQEVVEEAREAIRSGEVFADDVVNRGLAGRQLSARDQAIVVEYIGQLEDLIATENDAIESGRDMSADEFKTRSDRRDDALNRMSLAIHALERTGTEIARALAARKNIINRDMSLPGMIVKARKANGNNELSPAQLAQVRKSFQEIDRAQKRLQKRVGEITGELSQAKADIAMLIEKNKAELEYRKNKDKAGSRTEAVKDIQARRNEAKETLKKSIQDMLKLGFAFNPEQQAKQDANFLKGLGGLLRTYLDEALLKAGRVNYNSIINNMTRDLQEAYPDITKQQVQQLVDALNTDERPSLADIRAEISQLRTDIADSNLEADKKSLRTRIDNLMERIKNKDYATVPDNLQKYDAEYRQLRKELADREYDFRIAIERDKAARRSKIAKFTFAATEVFGLPRALMATGDLSAPLRQGIVAALGNPRTAISAFVDMHKFAFNPAYYEAYLEDIRDSEVYDLAMKSGLSLTGIGPDVWATLREEQFASKLLQRIPLLGKINEFSERGFAGFLNKMRIDLFNYQAEVLMNEGKNPIDDAAQFKAIATYVNAITGRGPVPNRWEGFFGDVSTALFAPRLITSRLYLLFGGPIATAIRSGNTNIAKQYVKDMTMMVSFGLVTSFLASMLPGVEILGDDDDEPLFDRNTWTSADFLNIRHGDTRYDIWGGFAQYIRLIARVITGQTVSSSGKVKFAEDEKYRQLSYIARFGRSKLSPSAAIGIDYTLGEDYMGEDFSLAQGLQNMLVPLVYQETIESMFGGGYGELFTEAYNVTTNKDYKWNQDGKFKFNPTALATVGLPSFYGLGVQNWESNSFLNKGVDNELIDVLNKKKLNTMSKRKSDVSVIDPNTGLERDLTDDEFDAYKKTWDNYVTAELRKNKDRINGSSEKGAEKIFNNIKRAATILAKKEVTGVSSQDMRVEFDNQSYTLNPDQLRTRIQEMENYKRDNARSYDRMRSLLVREGKSQEEADMEVQKEMDKDARSYTRDLIIDRYSKGRISLKETE